MMPAVACPDENELLRFFDGRAAPAARLALEVHLDSCSDCRDVLSAAEEQRRTTAALRPGDHVGRYEVERLAGEGAMGRVYVAHDTQLGRRVALKIVHGASSVLDEDALWQRTIREAQAMARLSHPNIVTVFDAGLEDGLAYVAMELCEGQNLSQWLGQRQRTVAEILRVFTQVADGLHAAHLAGIVHRDIKPQNVLIDPGGKARLTDFGLAFESVLPTAPVPTADVRLTRTGALVGTPAYMAAEQFDGKADGRSDQFSFCVTLYEALAGRRPFVADTVDGLRAAARSGAPPRPKGCPGWLHAAIARGLSLDPSARHPDLGRLRDVLEQGSRAKRRKLIAAAAGGVLMLGSLAAWQWTADRSDQSFSERTVTLAPGERRTFEIHGANRLSVGDPLIVDVKMVDTGKVELNAGRPGMTTLLVWWPEGRRESWLLRVVSAAPPGVPARPH